jgi:hypothetical protein
MMKIFKKNKTKQGYAVLELLFYISFFAVLSILVINAMVAMTDSFRETAIYSEFVQSGFIMEKISRDVRSSYSVNTITSTSLKLDTTDDAGVNKTVEFALSGADIQFLENDVLLGNLNTPNITITGLDFTEITTTAGKAIKIVLTLSSVNDKLGRSVEFYNTVALRGSY